MTSLNHDFNISSSCLSGNNHVLQQYPPNPMNFLSIRRVYYHSNSANHTVFTRHAGRHHWMGWTSSCALALIGREYHVLVICACAKHFTGGNVLLHVYRLSRTRWRIVCDNCEITSKTRGTNEEQCEWMFPVSSVANDAGKEAWQLKCCVRQTFTVSQWVEWQPSLGAIAAWV